MKKERILVIGACGQIGAELTVALRKQRGWDQVVAADLKPPTEEAAGVGPYEQLDALNAGAVAAVVNRYGISEIYLLAAMLSATGERHPQKAWQLNMQSLQHVLELAKEKKLAKVFWPSSIAVFGPDAPYRNCPQEASLKPTTVYGISKAAGEDWCRYYHTKYGVDIRSLRYPGLISYLAQPGGGTTDYAVDIYRQAADRASYTCYLRADTELPMMYMPDAIRATLELMAAPAERLTIRSSYNLAAVSVTPASLAESIKIYIPDFQLTCEPDYRQEIADSWPGSIDDGIARRDWGWDHQYSIGEMTRDMLRQLAQGSLV